MLNIILISHFSLAGGMKETLTYFSEEAKNIYAINAYENDVDPKEELEKAFSLVDTSKPVLIFTDLMGGSVNQYSLPFLEQKGVYIFSGMNLPMILHSMFLADDVSEEEIFEIENVGRQAVVCMNDYNFGNFSEEDE